MRDYDKVKSAVVMLLADLGIDLKDPNFIETPRRLATWLMEFTKSEEELVDSYEEFASAVFPHKGKDMLVSDPFTVFSMCPHHILPVEYRVNIGYIPNGQVVGLSKLIRITDAVSKQLLLQEDFTPLLADILCKYLETDHVAVRVKGTHSCMRIRGVKNGPAFTNTALRGVFDTEPKVRKEFYDIMAL